MSSTVSLSLSLPTTLSLFFVHTTHPLIPLSALSALLFFFPPPLLSSEKPSGYESNVVSGPSEVTSLLHLAQLPLADPQGSGTYTAAAHAWPLPLLHPRLPCQEDPWGLTRW